MSETKGIGLGDSQRQMLPDALWMPQEPATRGTKFSREWPVSDYQ
jgi:hypothetical protein